MSTTATSSANGPIWGAVPKDVGFPAKNERTAEAAGRLETYLTTEQPHQVLGVRG